MTDWEAEDLLRNALAESAAAVDARPDLDLIRVRINADKPKAPAAATAEAPPTITERTDS